MKSIARKPKFHKMKARTNIKTRKPKVRKNIDKKKVTWNEPGRKEE